MAEHALLLVHVLGHADGVAELHLLLKQRLEHVILAQDEGLQTANLRNSRSSVQQARTTLEKNEGVRTRSSWRPFDSAT